jgi:hypothetical protein
MSQVSDISPDGIIIGCVRLLLMVRKIAQILASVCSSYHFNLFVVLGVQARPFSQFATIATIATNLPTEPYRSVDRTSGSLKSLH